MRGFRRRISKVEQAADVFVGRQEARGDPREQLLAKLTRRPDEPLSPPLSAVEAEELTALLHARADELITQTAVQRGRRRERFKRPQATSAGLAN